MFSLQKIWFLATVALSFLFDKHCPITELLGSKDSSYKLQVNCAINFYFCLYLVIHAYDQRFDVTWNLENFCELNKALVIYSFSIPSLP